MDLQYPVTIIRTKLKEAFVSWEALDSFIGGLTMSLYNGMYINHYRYTKALVSSAYKGNKVVIKQVSAINSEANAKAFITTAREMFLNFQAPTTEFNSWSKNDGAGSPITTWTNPEDIVFLIKNSARAYLDVNVLASAFNIDRTTLMGNIYPVDNFDVFSDDGEKIFDGSAIIGIMADRNWFKIKTVDEFMEEQRNANNRSIQYYLNDIRMYEFSNFANAVVFATALPEDVPYTSLSFGTDEIEVAASGTKNVTVTALPTRANESITYTSSSSAVFTVAADATNDRKCVVTATGSANDTATLTATSGSGEDAVTGTVTIKIVAGS